MAGVMQIGFYVENKIGERWGTMKKVFVCMAALSVAGIATAEILYFEAEEANGLGTNYISVADTDTTNASAVAYGGYYITQQYDRTDAAPLYPATENAYYALGDLEANFDYDLYVRIHIGTNTFGDDSIWISNGFQTNTFELANGLSGAIGLDGQSVNDDGFHWIKVNGGPGDLGARGPYNTGPGSDLYFAFVPREDGFDLDAFALVPSGQVVTDDMLNPANAGVALWVGDAIPGAPTLDTTPLMEAYFIDGAETVDTGNITMTVDDVAVTGITTSKSNGVTTVSYTPTTALDAGITHTAVVVVASSPSAILFTNAWSFEVISDPINYVDATALNTIMASSTNGPVGDGTAFVGTDSNVQDGQWAFRTGFGVVPTAETVPLGEGVITLSASNTVFESTGWNDDNLDNVPRLKTSVSGLEDATYEVFVFFWNDETGSDWTIRAALEDLAGTDSLPVITNFTTVATDTAGREFRQASLGIVSGTAFDVFVEDLPAESGTMRTWYDGVGYRIAGASMEPVIQAISITGSTVTLIWTSEAVGTYQIMYKSRLGESTWTPLKMGISGQASMTTDSVDIGEADKGFFMIEGN